jgi:hypothetical protein
VVNIIDQDYRWCEDSVNNSRISRVLYSLFPDDPFDQIIIIKVGKKYGSEYEQTTFVKNEIAHNGGRIYNNGALYGSAGRLMSFVCVRPDGIAVNHEFAHGFVQQSTGLTEPGAHYYASDDPGPLTVDGRIVEISPGLFKQENPNNSTRRNYRQFNKLTLRFMSLLCPADFGQTRTAFTRLRSGEEITAAQTLLLDDTVLTDRLGSMSPSCIESRKNFRVVFVLVTQEGFASDALISGINALAVYHEGDFPGELINGIQYISDFDVAGSLKWASRGLADFETSLPAQN